MRKTRLSPKLVLLTLLLFALSSCERKKYPDPTGAPPLVVVSIPPYIEFVQKIAGTTVSVMSAVPPQYDPHIFEITPKQITELGVASLWIGVHEQFEHKIVPILQQSAPNFHYVDLTTRIPLLSFSQDTTPLIPHEHTHHGDHACCGKEGFDRHIWMSISLAPMQARVIRDALIDILPEFADVYQKNYLAFVEEIEATHRSMENLLAQAKGSALVVNHASLGYFCHDFSLEQLALETEGKALLPKQLSEVEGAVKKHGVRCIFVMPQFEDKGAKEIARLMKLSIQTIDPLAENYLENLYSIAEKVAQCKEGLPNDCAPQVH